MKTNTQWFNPESGFFGEFYQRGDNSLKGYLSHKPQTQEERTKEEVEGVRRLLHLKWGFKHGRPLPPSICDCPCGIGRHSIALAEMGFTVLAVDSNPDQLIVGEKKTELIPLNGRPIFMLKDMRNLTFDSKFDAVINMFFSFGFFEADEENKKVLQNFFNLLKPNGKFLMHTDVNMARIRNGTYKFNEKRELPEGKSLYVMERYNPRIKRIKGIWEIIEGKEDGPQRCEARDYSVRVYENDEFIALCKSVGFKNVKIYSDWQGSPYNEESEMVIFVAEK